MAAGIFLLPVLRESAMTHDQILVFIIMNSTIALFLWGHWRHDMVAMASLLACVLTGLVPAQGAFSGFGHPAVITVALVLVLSAGLQTTGAVDVLARRVLPSAQGATVSIAAVTGLGALLSAFMNNVGAMALLMPIAIQIAARQNLPPGKVLMPLAFGTILGGMTTLIGTPPNLIVSAFRAKAAGSGFAMFDFTPVGLSVASAGVLLCALLGWRMVPAREHKDTSSFDTGTYVTEARVMETGPAAEKTLGEIESILEQSDAQAVGLVHAGLRIIAPSPGRRIHPEDILVIEAEPESLATILSALGLKLAEDIPPEPQKEENPSNRDSPSVKKNREETEPEEKKDQAGEQREEENILQELVVMTSSSLPGRSASTVHLRTRYGLNLLAISRQGRRTIKRLRTASIKAGDVLLMQGPPEALSGFASQFGCVPLAGRAIHIPDRKKMAIATAVMITAIVCASLGYTSAATSFALGVLFFALFHIIPIRKIYEAVDWPVIVLLGALIPVAGATATTGAADVLAQFLLQNVARGNPVVALTMILVVTMTLSDFMNNAATAAVMCPIALSSAAHLGAAPDAFFMAVAIGASCAFLTPIGHQNNTLILGPGGFRFGDYWRLGLPMEILVVVISIPMLLLVWPLA